MKGLIIKDLLTMKNNLKTVILVIFVFGVLALQGESNFSFVLPLICIMLFISTFSYDNYNKWDIYACTLPNGRKNVVASKYVASLILIVISTLITAIISILITINNNTFDTSNIISLLLGGILATSFIVSIMYPLIFKFGIEKGRIFLFIGVIAVTLLLGIITKNINITTLITIIDKYYFIIIPFIIIIMLFVSYLISKKVYLHKEF